MLKRFAAVSAFVLLFCGASAVVFGASGAGAQTSICKEGDLKCRVAVLEARVDALTAELDATRNVAAKAAASADAAIAATPSRIDVRRFCKVSCAEEALDECKKRGFSSGKPDDWDRPKSGPISLTRASCTK